MSCYKPHWGVCDEMFWRRKQNIIAATLTFNLFKLYQSSNIYHRTYTKEKTVIQFLYIIMLDTACGVARLAVCSKQYIEFQSNAE